MLYFTSDHHFNHKAVLGYCNRPFASVEQMDEIMIQRWNEVVSPNDTVYHLGDFTLGADAKSYILRLNGQINFVVPDFHHDKRWLKNKPDLPNVEYLSSIYPLKVNKDILIVMCHYPFAAGAFERAHYGAWHLYGHVHSPNFHLAGFCLNVGVDHHNFYPVSLDYITKYMLKRSWQPGWKAPHIK
jgi:calcineurin-like phosphoesterase family protein